MKTKDRQNVSWRRKVLFRED